MNASDGDLGKPYREVRALDRGLRLVEALADQGWSTPQTLARATSIDRATVYRLLTTLVRTGYVFRRPEDGRYALTAKIRQVGSGVRDDDRLVEVVSPLLADLVRRVFWPSDFAMLVGGRLRIVASSHHLTSSTFFRGLVGKERPLVGSALGHAILSAMTDEARDHALTASSEGTDRESVRRIVDQTRAAGYASAVGSTFTKISAIALPVSGAEGVMGAINLVFFRSALSLQAAAERYLDDLKVVVTNAERALRAEAHAPNPSTLNG